MAKIGRNDPCPCGSGKKYKKCCLLRDEELARQAAARPVQAQVPAVPPSPAAPPFTPRQLPEESEPWARFDAAETQEERIRIFREALAEQSLDAGYAYEMLAEIRSQALEPDALETVVGLLDELRTQAPVLYQETVHVYNGWLIEYHLERLEYQPLPALLEPFGREPDRFIGEPLWLIPMLMYHGQTAPLLGVLRQGWPALQRSAGRSRAGVEEYRKALVVLAIFDYVESTTAPHPDDPALRAALDGLGALDEARRSLPYLLGQAPDPLDLSDFQHPRSPDEQMASAKSLTLEWLGDAYHREVVPLARGELARSALLGYLGKRLEEGAAGRRLLLPAAEPLWRHLWSHIFEADEDARAFDVGSLLELLPDYVAWLAGRGFVAPASAPNALRGLHAVQDALLHAFQEETHSRAAIRAIERAGMVTRQVDPRQREVDPGAQYPLLARLRNAGKEPDPALLNEIKALAPAIVCSLVAMATDERLHFAGEDDPAVWAPLHAVRLLGELAAAQAVEPLLPLFEWDDDWLHEALPEAYGRIGEPALAPLRDLIFDHELDLYSRARASNGLAKIAEFRPALRSAVLDALAALLAPAETRTDDDRTLNGFVIGDLLDLKAMETLPAIQRAFEDRRVDESVVDFGFVREELGLARRRTPRFAPRLGLPVPAGKETGGSSGPSLLALPTGLPAQAGQRISRNQPCPCGSGKKYKKCCGR